jgi:hypothetical protein
VCPGLFPSLARQILRRIAVSLPRIVAASCFSILNLSLCISAYAGIQFQPVSPEELKMTSEPRAPGAPAIILYREVRRDDCGITCNSEVVSTFSVDRFEHQYMRIKILTEAGRSYGTVEIRLSRDMGTVDEVKARTIQPDGSIVDFNGQIFEKTITRRKGIEYRAKIFNMPDVQVGSIIEFYYKINFVKGSIFSSYWDVSHELFTKKAKFFLRPFRSGNIPMNFRWNEHLPAGTPSPKLMADGNVELDVENIPAFHVEDFMPPEDELKARVEFVYSRELFESNADKFWRTVGKNRYNAVEKFIGRRGAMEQIAAEIVSPSDTQEFKLKKIYARVQQLHNLSFEPVKTQQEQQREKINPYENVEDIWRRGSGWDWQLTWLYLALARTAGAEAYPVLVADRSKFFFNPQSMQSGRLDASLVLVKLNGKDLYLNPGGAFTEFGMLPWEETATTGLRLDKDGGSWVQTNLPDSSASQIDRKASLKLSSNGDLEGNLLVTFTGLEGQQRRFEERSADDTERKKFLEDEIKGYIPAGSDVELTKQPDWSNTAVPLVAEVSVKVPGWAAVTGRRALFPVGIFSETDKNVFQHTERVHPIYFKFLSQTLDDITIELPSGWQIASVPQPQNQDLRVVSYLVSAENNKGVLHLTRKVDVNILTMEPKYYSPIRSFFQIVKAGDEQQVVLAFGATPGS